MAILAKMVPVANRENKVVITFLAHGPRHIATLRIASGCGIVSQGNNSRFRVNNTISKRQCTVDPHRILQTDSNSAGFGIINRKNC